MVNISNYFAIPLKFDTSVFLCILQSTASPEQRASVEKPQLCANAALAPFFAVLPFWPWFVCKLLHFFSPAISTSGRGVASL